MRKGELTVKTYSKNINLWQKWLCQAYIAGIDTFRVAYISREDEDKYNILKV